MSANRKRMRTGSLPAPASFANENEAKGVCLTKQADLKLIHDIRDVSQNEALIPSGVETTLDGLRLLLAFTLGIRDQLEFDIGV